MTDQQALQQYATRNDAEAFRLLVENYQRLVYGAARRRLSRAGTAKDVLSVVKGCFDLFRAMLFTVSNRGC